MSAETLHVLFLSSWYPSEAHPTLGNFVARHAEAVASRHHVSALYVAGLAHAGPDYRIEQHELNGVATTVVYYRRGGFRAWMRRRKAFRLGLRAIGEEQLRNTDIVHHNVLWPDVWQAVWLKRKYRIPFIVTEHWTGYDQTERAKPGRRVRWMSAFGCRHAARICPVTENLATAMQSFGLHGHYTVVPNVVDTSLFTIGNKAGDETRFLHVSSLLDVQKNISGLLRAWKAFLSQGGSGHLTIGGDGPVSLHQAYALQLGIPMASLTFFPEKTPAEIAAIMSGQHALVLFSNYENLPCVIVEAMASGMAVIATRTGGIAEHVDETRGMLVGKRMESELTDALVRFCASRHHYEPAALRSYAEAHFSIPSIAEAFTRIYLDVIHPAQPRNGHSSLHETQQH